MDKFETVTGTAIPLPRNAVDTDQIIPAVFLKRIVKTGYDDALFHEWRKDESFVLNQPWAQGATVLFAGPDFGTGSSREHAVWALRDFGFRVVLSSRFGDIFRGNSGKQGLLAAALAESDIDRLWELIDATPGIEMTVDLVGRTVTAGGETFPFEVDDYTRWRLIEGLDDIGLTLRDEALISEFETRRASWRPKTLPVK